ncbi:MAG: Rrf2 family transcriptional regulator [Bacteroidales bacterium]
MFSKACEYAIKATVYIIDQSLNNQKTSLKEIANTIDSPEAYTSKILQQLSKENIILSEKGPTGGFSIDKTKAQEIKLSTIVSAIDGDSIYQGCGLGFKQCSENKPCVIHHKFKAIRDGLKEMLENTLLVNLSKDITDGKSFFKR